MPNLNQRLVTDLVFAVGNPAPAVSPTVNPGPGPEPNVIALYGPIPAGATVIIKHGLVQTERGPVAPTIVFPDRSTILQVVAADDQTITILNPGTVDQEVTLRCERKHTIEEDPSTLTKMLWKGTSETPPILGLAIVVYAPGLVSPAPPFFNNWADVETAVNAVNGACQLWIDMTGLSGFAPVPSTANLDGKGRLEIIGKGPNGEAELQVADGGQIKNVQTWRTIVVRGQSTIRPPLLWDIDGMILECWDATFLFDGPCTQPVMQLSVPTYIGIFMSHSSELRNSHFPGNAVMNIGPGALCFLSIDELFFGSSFDDTISGPVGSTLEIQTDGSLPPSFSLPAFLGTLTFRNIDFNIGQAGGKIGAFGVPAVTRPVVVGSRGGNAALASFLTGMASLGWIIDNTVP